MAAAMAASASGDLVMRRVGRGGGGGAAAAADAASSPSTPPGSPPPRSSSPSAMEAGTGMRSRSALPIRAAVAASALTCKGREMEREEARMAGGAGRA